MAGSLNKVMLIGNLGADPEVRTFNNGGKVANIRIATSENWKDKNTGEKRETTEWHSIAFHGDGLVGVVEKYLTKGDKIYVEGQLKTRKWQDQSGNDRYSTEILVNSFSGTMKMLSTKRDGAPGGGGSGGGGNDGWGSGGSSGGGGGSGAFDSDLDDDVPF